MEEKFTLINIIFDGPPNNESGRFVEVETDDGKSINIGAWSEHNDGHWALRITELPTDQGSTRLMQLNSDLYRLLNIVEDIRQEIKKEEL